MKKINFLKLKIIVVLFSTSMFCSGFSSWLIGVGDNNNFNINFNFGEINNVEYLDTAFYIKNSEDGFDFYTFTNDFGETIRVYTDSQFSIRIKISPKMMETSFTSDIFATFGIMYELSSNVNYDIFSENDFLIAPYYITFQLENTNRKFYSNNLVHSLSTTGTKTSYILSSSVLLFSSSKPSLYSTAKAFQKNNEFLYFSVCFDFKIISLNYDAIFNTLKFNFLTSLPEAIN